MNRSSYFLLYTLLWSQAIYWASAQRFDPIDEVPHDIVYLRNSKLSDPKIKVTYGRPTTSETTIFGTIVAYNELWRTGANESTEIKFYQPVCFGGVHIPSGTYTLLSIPNKARWQILINSQIDMLGAHFYDPYFNIGIIDIKPTYGEHIETFSIAFKKFTPTDSQMIVAWGDTRIVVPIKIDAHTDNHKYSTAE